MRTCNPRGETADSQYDIPGYGSFVGESLRAGVQKPAPTIARSNGHHRDWLDAIKGGKPASSHFAYGARLTEIGLLGVLALRLGKPIEWDGANLKVAGRADAEPMIRGTYRAEWALGT